MQQLVELVRQKPDAYLRELVINVEAQLGVCVTRQTLGDWRRDVGITRKYKFLRAQ